MCGIAGASWFDPELAIESPTLERMQAVLHHRGPDEQGRYQADHAALVHVRLSIIDLSTGQQPLGNEDDTIQIVFNGEIYNFQDLKRQLLARGHQFRTASDTEVIVHLYEEFGTDCFPLLRGMFALAIWDGRNQRLVVARDRMGKKPLVYREEPNRLSFASEIKALLEIPDARHTIDPVAVDEYLTYGYVPHPRTIYREIRKFPPGCYGIYERGRLTIQRYWNPDTKQIGPLTDGEWVDRLRDTLSEATRIRMISDVPLGAFLSGGLDSSVICAVMQQQSSRPIKTFSIRFNESQFDEGHYAAEVAEHLGTEHHEYYVTEASYDLVPKLVWHFDEPFADGSAIPTYFVSHYARQEVTVALTGDGADELFWGYDRYRVLQRAALLDWMPAWTRRSLARLGKRESGGWLRRFGTMLDLSARTLADRYAYISAVGFREPWRHQLYTPDFLKELGAGDPLDVARGAFLNCAQGALQSASAADQATYLPGDILAKVDVTSMACSLECRSPFLDAEVVDLARAMPAHLKLRGGIGKYIIRKALGSDIPQAAVRRPKMGFVVPIQNWLRRDFRHLLDEILLDGQALGRGIFRPEAIRKLVSQHQSGAVDHTRRLWALLWFELWHRTFVDVARPQMVTL